MMSENNANSDQREKNLIRFGSKIDLFIKHIDSIGDVLLGMVYAVQHVIDKVKNELEEFEEKNCKITEKNGEKYLSIPVNHIKEWKKRKKRYDHFLMSHTLLPRSLLVSLISQYDAFLGRILKSIFILKPEILNTSEKKIPFDTLIQFPSIDAVKEHVFEKEVESILRTSHADQFKWMETNFSTPLTKDLEIWGAFIELTERRNLFVHTDGIVSSQYMTVCKLHKCHLDKGVKEGSVLSVPQKYFEEAHNCIYEIGIKLSHVLWRKLFPNDRQHADDNFIRISYDLIENGKYQLASKMLDFACTCFTKFSDEASQLTLIINRAQAYKWLGKNDECISIMRNIDWSAKGDQ